jgi:Rod binding domain-containing protein
MLMDELSFKNTLADRDWQFAAGERNLHDLKGSSAKNDKRVADSAKAFESLLIGKWLEAAEDSLATVPGGTEDEQNDNPLKQFSSLAIQSLAEGISGSGGFGISRILMKGLEKSAGNDVSH